MSKDLVKSANLAVYAYFGKIKQAYIIGIII